MKMGEVPTRESPRTGPRTNRSAVAALLFNLLGFPIGSGLALFFGYRALREIPRTRERGRGLALAGIIWGWAAIIIVGVIFASWAIPEWRKIGIKDVTNQSVKVAFAQRSYRQEHGRYAHELDELDFEHDGRIKLYMIADDDRFCVEAFHGSWAVSSWWNDFIEEPRTGEALIRYRTSRDCPLELTGLTRANNPP